MKAVLLAIGLAAALPSPAAACRLHKVWHYPWPQRCGLRPAQRPPARPAKLALSFSPSKEAAKINPPSDDELRQRAIEKLKVEFAIRNAMTANVPQMSPAYVPKMSR